MLAMFRTVLAPVVLALGIGGVLAPAQAPSAKKTEPPKSANKA